MRDSSKFKVQSSKFLFAVSFFLYIILFSSPIRIFADQLSPDSSLSAVPSSDLSISVLPTQSIVDYQLPYPGLLPDNSFYFLKVLRDRIEGFLISKPLSKASFDLLQSDKRISAAAMLLDGHRGKIDLAISTFSKGENYFDEGIENILDARRQGLDVRDLQHQFVLSQAKHVEVLQSMEQIGVKRDKKKFLPLETRLRNFAREMKHWER